MKLYWLNKFGAIDHAGRYVVAENMQDAIRLWRHTYDEPKDPGLVKLVSNYEIPVDGL